MIEREEIIMVGMGGNIADVMSAAGQGVLAGGVRPYRVNRRTGVVQVRTPRGLVVNSLLRKDEWELLDRTVMEAAKYPLRGVADLKSRGLVKPLGSLGTLISQWNTSSEMTPANVTMTGQSAGDRDRVEFNLAGVPVPVIWKEFSIGTRQLEASRRMGDALDTTHVYEATRVVAEMEENMLFNGASVVLNSSAIYGYRTHPNRNTDTATNYGGGDWGTIANIVPTVAGMISAANGDRHYGPFVLYVSTTQYNEAALAYFTDGSGDTPLQRILNLPQISAVQQMDTAVLPAGQLLLVQMTMNVVDWAEAQDITVVEWMSGDGMTNEFKVMAVAAPRVKADYATRSGVVHATGA
jgi:uncharacterized linocin/CFP29 family protein